MRNVLFPARYARASGGQGYFNTILQQSHFFASSELDLSHLLYPLHVSPDAESVADEAAVD